MQTTNPGGLRHPALVAFLMTAIAGYFDAIGYSELDHLYLSFMSGNSTRLGMALVAGDRAVIAGVLSIVGSFVIGSMAGAYLVEASGDNKFVRIWVCELMLIALTLVLTLAGAGWIALVFISMAMGIQNTIHQKIAGADIGKSFITGALSAAGQSLVLAFKGRASFREPASYGLSWLVFVAGVALGAVVWNGIGLSHALMVAVTVLAGLISATRLGWL